MDWTIEKITLNDSDEGTLDAELSELWGLRFPRGLVFPNCQLDYTCLYRLIELGSLWRMTDVFHRVWLDVVDKRHIETIGYFNMQNVSFDCDEEAAFAAIKQFIDTFPDRIVTLVPPSVADCDLFDFWRRFAGFYGVKSDGPVIRYWGDE